MADSSVYLAFSSGDILGLEKEDVAAVWAEVRDGKVTREIAFSSGGQITAVFPDISRPRYRGLFDLVPVSAKVSNLSASEFEEAFRNFPRPSNIS